MEAESNTQNVAIMKGTTGANGIVLNVTKEYTQKRKISLANNKYDKIFEHQRLEYTVVIIWRNSLLEKQTKK